MLGVNLRPAVGRFWAPVVTRLARAGVTADMVTVTGTLGAIAAAVLLVARGETVFAVLNLYPYNAGHLMVVPYRHVPDYTDLTDAEVAEMGAFTQTAMRVVRQVTGAHGFNIGMNQGAVAGAGIADHLHQHAVPRWGGDTNFMPVIGLTRVLPQVLAETRKLLAEGWAAQAGEA